MKKETTDDNNNYYPDLENTSDDNNNDSSTGSLSNEDAKIFEKIRKKKKVNKRSKTIIKTLKHVAENSFGEQAVSSEMTRIVNKIISKINECSAKKYGSEHHGTYDDNHEQNLHVVRFFSNYEKIIIDELLVGNNTTTKNEVIYNINKKIDEKNDDNLENYSSTIYNILRDTAEFTCNLRKKLQETNHIISASKSKEHWISRLPLHIAIFSFILSLQLFTNIYDFATNNNDSWHKTLLIPSTITLAYLGSIFLVYRRVPQSISAEIFKCAEPEYNKFKGYLITTYWPKTIYDEKQLSYDEYVMNLEEKIFTITKN